jgi:hypothetical protein
MNFQKGLNVIIGANNSGKTGLLYAIRLLNEPTLSADDFNKNNLLNYSEHYLDDAPSIEIEYVVRHMISETDTEDESIIRLLPFLGMDKLAETKSEDSGNLQYDVTAVIKTVCALDSKALGEYRNAAANVANFNEYMTVLKSFISRYSWTYSVKCHLLAIRLDEYPGSAMSSRADTEAVFHLFNSVSFEHLYDRRRQGNDAA